MTTFPLAVAATLALALALATGASAHQDFAAGTPGDASAPARTIDLTIRELPDGRMDFGTPRVAVKQDDQIRFVIENDGRMRHEFRIDSVAGDAAHKAMMERMPAMVHHDSNAVTIAPGRSASLVWRFTKPGTYEFACLVPGHYESGMHGAIVVAARSK